MIHFRFGFKKKLSSDIDIFSKLTQLILFNQIVLVKKRRKWI